MDFGFGLKDLVAGPINIKNTRIGGRVTNNMMYLDFLSLDEDEKLMHILALITQEDDNLKIHIDDKDLILNRNKWRVNPNNSILFTDRKKNFYLLVYRLLHIIDNFLAYR